MRKLFKIMILITSVVFIVVACGNKDVINNEHNNSEDKQDVLSEMEQENISTKIDFSESFQYVGYQFYYPLEDNSSITTTNYGKIFEYEGCCVFVETPAAAGIALNVKDINETPTICEEYVIKTLENSIRALFDYSQTEQVITNKEVITVNDIQMLRVDGVFKNSEKDKDISYVAYYFLVGPEVNQPIYCVGIAMDEKADVDSFMDEFVKQIKKNE